MKTQSLWAALVSGSASALLLLGLPATVRAQEHDHDAGALAAAEAEVTMLRFYDGSILWGSIADHDAETVHLRRLDNGGLVRVPWSRLDPVLADELLTRFGYVDLSGDEVMVEADRLVLDDGTEIIGKIVSRTEADLLVKTSNALMQVPKVRLRAAATIVQVPALDVYTSEELYSQELTRLDAQDPRSHLELAQFCERVFAFDRAVEHLEAARALDPTLDASELEAGLVRNRRKLENLGQLEHMREADRMRSRGRFDQALAHIELFKESYPKSPLLRDMQRKQAQVERARERALREKVVRTWHGWARKLTFSAARDPNMTLEAAITWLEDGLHDDVLAAVHEELSRTVSANITTDEVATYWAARENGRWQKATYSMGTWLLGEDAALAGMPETKDPSAEPESETAALRRRLEERMKRYERSQSVVRRASSGFDSEEERNSFWTGWSSSGRSGWMLAYYAENSGDMELRPEVFFRACRDCGGSGVRHIIKTGGSVSGSAGAHDRTVPCRTCHNVGQTRRISFR